MPHYTIIESKVWVRDDGARASIYGAVPYHSESERKRWNIIRQGFTLRNEDSGTVGIGRPPFETIEQAQDHLAMMKARGLAR